MTLNLPAAPVDHYEGPARVQSIQVVMPDAVGPWTAGTRRVLSSNYVRECMATFATLCGTEGKVLWALLKGHWRTRGTARGLSAMLEWLWEFFSRSPEETLKTLKSLNLSAELRSEATRTLIGRGTRMIGTGLGVAQAILAWGELAKTMDDRNSTRTEKIIRFVVFGASLLGCLPKLPQLRLLSSGIALLGAVLEAGVWSRKQQPATPAAAAPPAPVAPVAPASAVAATIAGPVPASTTTSGARGQQKTWVA